MLLQPNYYFDNHAEASYELILGKDWESMQREEEARLKEKARKEREMDESVLRAALVPYTADNDEDVDDDDIEKNEGFLGWDMKSGDDSSDQRGDEDTGVNGLAQNEDNASIEHKSNEKDTDESEWDQLNLQILIRVTNWTHLHGRESSSGQKGSVLCTALNQF